MRFLTEGYEDSICPDGIASAGKASYVERNHAMVLASDFCVFYYNENYLPDMRKASKKAWMQKLFRKFWVTQTSRPHCKCTPSHLCSPNAVCWRLPVPCPALPKKHIRRHYFGQKKEKCRLPKRNQPFFRQGDSLTKAFLFVPF